jgi:uncharacterized protein (TIGR03435 family)
MAFAQISAFVLLLSGYAATSWAQSETEGAMASALSTFSITPNKSGTRWQTIETYPDKLRATNETLASLIQAAYKVDADQISHAPNWVTSERFNIVATAADSTAHGQVLRVVLSDRFKLSFHRELKPVSVYALVIAANGPNLSESTAGYPHSPLRVIQTDNGQIAGREVPIATLAKILSEQLHETVLDETGLDHHYDITLRWQPNSESSVVAVSKALEEQLGLKLVRKQMSREFFVIDHVEAIAGIGSGNRLPHDL